MEIKVHKLKSTMELLKPVVPKKPSVKAIACIALGNGKAIGTDLETMVIANLPEAKEEMLLPFAAVSEMLKYVSSMDTVKIELKGKMVSLAWEGGSASYPTEDYANFPALQDMQIRADSQLDGDALIAAMADALPYVAGAPGKGGTSRPVLEGETLILGNPVEVAAGDGFRMTHQVLGLSYPLEEKLIIPAHSVAVLEHIFQKTPRTPPSTADTLVKAITAKRMLRVSLMGENKLRVDFGTSASVIVNLIDGKPPEWLKLVPTGEPIMQSQIFALHFEAAVKRVRDIAKEGSGIVRLEFINGRLKVSAKGGDQEISSTIDTMLTQGESKRVGINQSYLLDFLSGKQGIMTLSIYTDNGPVVFEYSKSPRVLIMPMQVQWADTPPAEEPAADIKEDVKSESGDDTESDSENSAETAEAETEPVAEE
ncbi:MAG: hypothetical protein PHE15_06565 [Dehalococcoidales bacterium]|nr:hypothetical protein [Dehalococcoidales bacterium]